MKRKGSPVAQDEPQTASKRRAESPMADTASAIPPEVPSSTVDTAQEATEQTSTPPTGDSAPKSNDRRERFKALQARQNQSRMQNRKETAAEAKRHSIDPNLLTSLNRKTAMASHKLMRADAEAAGEDFERKRAWDWTIDESEKWDKRMAKKDRNRDGVAFADYTQEARKAYKKQMRELKPDMAGYEREKADAIRRAAASGGLELVETEDGELVAIDKDGAFYSTADTADFQGRRPDKDKVDALVKDLQKAEDLRMRKRRERAGKGDDADVTYINEKNKQFNLKLQRFYDKYTTDIRESFERGTAL